MKASQRLAVLQADLRDACRPKLKQRWRTRSWQRVVQTRHGADGSWHQRKARFSASHTKQGKRSPTTGPRLFGKSIQCIIKDAQTKKQVDGEKKNWKEKESS